MENKTIIIVSLVVLISVSLITLLFLICSGRRENLFMTMNNDLLSSCPGGAVPLGTIVAFGILDSSGSNVDTTKIPEGWAICDGRTTPNGITTPDLRGKFIKGSGSDGVSSNHPAVGGGKTNITLTADQVPLKEHAHEFQIRYTVGTSGGGDENRINAFYDSSNPASTLLEYSGTSEGAILSGLPTVNPLVIDIPSYIPSQSVLYIMYVGTKLGSTCVDKLSRK